MRVSLIILNGNSSDACVYTRELAPMLVVGLIPFAVLLFIVENNTKHNVLSQMLTFFVGCWALLAVRIVAAILRNEPNNWRKKNTNSGGPCAAHRSLSY